MNGCMYEYKYVDGYINELMDVAMELLIHCSLYFSEPYMGVTIIYA